MKVIDQDGNNLDPDEGKESMGEIVALGVGGAVAARAEAAGSGIVANALVTVQANVIGAQTAVAQARLQSRYTIESQAQYFANQLAMEVDAHKTRRAKAMVANIEDVVVAARKSAGDDPELLKVVLRAASQRLGIDLTGADAVPEDCG